MRSLIPKNFINNLAVTFCLIIYACNSDEKTQHTSNDSTNINSNIDVGVRDQIDYKLSSAYASIEKYKDQFSPKDVFFEIVLRESAKDTLIPKDTLPPTIKLNYTIQEISLIKQKIQPLKSLSNIQLLSLYSAVNPGNKVIYGQDNRSRVIYDTKNIDSISDIENPYMTDGKGVVALISKERLSRNSNGDFVLGLTESLKDHFKVCETERFLNDPVVADCSGFAVSSNRIVTAGHCLDATNYKGYYFVFDFITDQNGNYSKVISQNNVYEATEFIAGLLDHNSNEDFAVVKVNKPINIHRIVSIDSGSNFSPSTLFHVIGCPCGTPLKLAAKANIRSSNNRHYFTITSDTYGGNSGSPVFNSDTHLVEGILVRGEKDFSFGIDNCYLSVVCPFNGCRGEDVSRCSQFLKFIH